MYNSVYQNSYVVAIIIFIILYIVFYLFQISCTTDIVDGKLVKKFNWKYPVAISLMIWLLWHFLLFPPIKNVSKSNSIDISELKNIGKYNKIMDQKIIMANWN